MLAEINLDSLPSDSLNWYADFYLNKAKLTSGIDHDNYRLLSDYARSKFEATTYRLNGDISCAMMAEIDCKLTYDNLPFHMKW